MPRMQFDITEEFAVRTKLAAAEARARGDFTGTSGDYARQQISKKLSDIMTLLKYPELPSAAPAPTPPPPDPQPAFRRRPGSFFSTNNGAAAAAASVKDIFGDTIPPGNDGLPADFAAQLSAGIARSRVAREVDPPSQSFPGVTFNAMGPVVTADFWKERVDQIYTNANGNISEANRDFLDEKTESFANFGNDIKLTFPSATSMGSARYFENLCRRYKVPCPVISSPPD
jgi:hypothetical protein